MSKNLYNYLNIIEINFFFKKQYFFVVKESLSSNRKVKSLYFAKRQFVKTNFKTHLTSSFFMLKNIKFPLHILFFLESSFLEDYFFNLFFENFVFLFFKYNSQLINLSKKPLVIFFNSSFRVFVLGAINKILIVILLNSKSKTHLV